VGLRRALEWVAVLAVALVVAVGVRAYAFQTFTVPSGSMEPTIAPRDHIVVDKLSVDFGSIHRGDIIVFRAPRAVARDCGDAVPDLVKRVIGLPGDHLASRGNTILVNGRPLDERWTHTEPLGTPVGPTVVPPHDYFVMGDNHDNSCDSRTWGAVPAASVIGKVFVRVWPPSRLDWF
jgi:signal peptidase I